VPLDAQFSPCHTSRYTSIVRNTCFVLQICAQYLLPVIVYQGLSLLETNTWTVFLFFPFAGGRVHGKICRTRVRAHMHTLVKLCQKASENHVAHHVPHVTYMTGAVPIAVVPHVHLCFAGPMIPRQQLCEPMPQHPLTYPSTTLRFVRNFERAACCLE